MITNQILLNTIEGLKGICRIDFCVYDTDGKVLAGTIENGQEFESAVLSPGNDSEETAINEINGVEPACILSGLSSPYGEQFIVRSKALLNARLWIGGILSLSRMAEKKPIEKLGAFIRKKIFCYQIEKQKH